MSSWFASGLNAVTGHKYSNTGQDQNEKPGYSFSTYNFPGSLKLGTNPSQVASTSYLWSHYLEYIQTHPRFKPKYGFQSQIHRITHRKQSGDGDDRGNLPIS
eukprot:TRINITY_DN37219_c1_g2_i1.p1 TRINITY_DN37219_c1_g2~~TRINITY_DN37219_c1_g2_i1.p1  ORF type:complete len:102 (+),score=8.96 TRINITY_DN37219_c1_g2_i1:111-416(+)